MTRQLTSAEVEAFDPDGLVAVDGVLSQAEVEVVLREIEEGARLEATTFQAADSAGRASPLALWTDIRDDVYGAVSAHPGIVDRARTLLREDVYHWHSKVMLKKAGKEGGAWEWHQDYGYWYHDGCPYPRMISVMVALDPATRKNGCLKVLVGSHQLGRLDHGKVGGQQGADADRLRAVENMLDVYYWEAKPGSALFFNCNTLHASEPNLSDRPRRAYICAYNAFSNVPVMGEGHGKPVPIPPSGEDGILRFATAAGE
jgi:hypothetical protein